MKHNAKASWGAAMVPQIELCFVNFENFVLDFVADVRDGVVKQLIYVLVKI